MCCRTSSLLKTILAFGQWELFVRLCYAVVPDVEPHTQDTRPQSLCIACSVRFPQEHNDMGTTIRVHTLILGSFGSGESRRTCESSSFLVLSSMLVASKTLSLATNFQYVCSRELPFFYPRLLDFTISSGATTAHYQD